MARGDWDSICMPAEDECGDAAEGKRCEPTHTHLVRPCPSEWPARQTEMREHCLEQLRRMEEDYKLQLDRGQIWHVRPADPGT